MNTINKAQEIIRKYNKEREDRVNRALKPLRDDKALESLVLPSVCDNCGNEHKCKAVPIGNGNAILCRKCHTSEMNYRRTNGSHYSMTREQMNEDTPAWFTLKWYNLPE